jgi:hypothetical protein
VDIPRAVLWFLLFLVGIEVCGIVDLSWHSSWAALFCNEGLFLIMLQAWTVRRALSRKDNHYVKRTQ